MATKDLVKCCVRSGEETQSFGPFYGNSGKQYTLRVVKVTPLQSSARS